ncbi:hypothetical protein TPA0907_30410 [Micromonospora humidisoli]|nr:hypothetical protein TPA0907_30410 [Micromonospora sp. AKA109]
MTQPAKRLLALLVATLAILATSLTPASPAAAAPIITGHSCPSGQGEYYCLVSPSGTVGPVTYTWYRDGHMLPIDPYSNQYFDYCHIGQSVTSRVVVTDSTGSTSSVVGFVCQANWD